MPTAPTSIWLALREHVENVTLNPALSISWPNQEFEPPTGSSGPDSYLKVKYFPNQTNVSSVGSRGFNRHSGILQITVVCPKNKDISIANEIAGTIAEWFSLGTWMSKHGVTVRTEAPPSIASLLETATMAETPVTIRYFADIQRN